jgi:lysophospholipase L1-like esterase
VTDSAPPTCTLWIDGVRYADGQPAELDGDPVALTGLSVVWGRDTTLDQPAPASCSFTVLDRPGGPRFTETLRVGSRVQVRADAVVYPDPTVPILTDPGFELAPAGSTPSTIPTNATVTVVGGGRGGGQAAAVDPVDAGRGVRVVFPPAPLTMDPGGWDAVPRTRAGQTWRYGAAVLAPNGLADVARVIVRPVTFTQPFAAGAVLDHQAAAGAADPAGWRSYSALVTPPAGVWLGVAVDIFPTGPAWADLPADMSWDELAWPADPGPPPAGTYTAAAFGDSITAGTWLPTYADSWIPKLEARLGISIANHAVGGAPIHDPGGGPVLLDQVTAALAGGPAPDVAIILAGTNDLVTHGNAELAQSAAAAQLVQDTLTAAGARVIWLAILPIGYGSSHPDHWLPGLLERRELLNDQLRPIAGPGCWFDTDYLFGAAGGLVTDPAWLLDGLHPTPAGASQMAAEFPADTLNPAFTGYRPTWQDLARTLVDDLLVLAPAEGAARAGEVFTGRITDLDAQWDAGAGGTAVDVTAQDDTAELANRYVGAQPWPAEQLVTRFGRILDAAGQHMAAIVDPTAAAHQVSYRDVDNQPSLALLQSLAQSVGGALWSATSLTTGPYLRLEDIDARPALLVLEMGDDDLVHIVPATVLGDRGVTVSACDVLLDPVHWQQSVDDDATRVTVGWRDQAPDPVKPTDRAVTAIDAAAEAATGRRRVQVSTELAAGADATALASSLLARLSTGGWRIRGITYRVELTDPLGPEGIALVMTILDATTRIGLPIMLTYVPSWSPAPTRADVPLFLEGARFTNDAGAWTLELITSSAVNQGAADVAWQDLPADWSWAELGPEIAWADLAGVGIE